MPGLIERALQHYERLGGTHAGRLGALPNEIIQRAKAACIARKGPFVRGIQSIPKTCFGPLVDGPLGELAVGRNLPSRQEGRNKPLALIVRHDHVALQPTLQSLDVRVLDNTIAASGVADFSTLSYDRELILSPGSDLQLIKACVERQPDLVIFSSWGKQPNHPSSYSASFIRRRLNIPVGVIWWDTCSEQFWPKLESCISHFDFHIIPDNPNQYLMNRSHPEFSRLVHAFPVVDPSLFYDEGRKRDIPVSFVGQANSYRGPRAETISHLIEAIPDGHFRMTGKGAFMSYEEYGLIMRRSQMCVNLPDSVGCPQVKGRVLETLYSGALLLEGENDQTSKLFEPMKDYVPFSSKEDLVEKIMYYLDHPAEAEAIARSGSAKASAKYSPKGFWELALENAQLKPSVQS